MRILKGDMREGRKGLPREEKFADALAERAGGVYNESRNSA